MKLKNKIKEKLRSWLFKEEIVEIEKIKDNINAVAVSVDAIQSTYDECLRRIEQGYIKIRDAADLHDKSHTLLEDCRKFMNSICDVSTDVGFKSSEHSWAIICVHGKMDYVKFIDMSHRDIMEISHFLKRFEYSNRVTDSPLGYKHMFEDAIMRL